MSWWKKILRAVGIGGKVYGEIRTAKDPTGKTGRMVSAGADILLAEIEKDEKAPVEPEPEKKT